MRVNNYMVVVVVVLMMMVVMMIVLWCSMWHSSNNVGDSESDGGRSVLGVYSYGNSGSGDGGESCRRNK